LRKSGEEGLAVDKMQSPKNAKPIRISGWNNELNTTSKQRKISHVPIYKGAKTIKKVCKKLQGLLKTLPLGLLSPLPPLHLTLIPRGLIPTAKFII
jgi:hypothetical protein